jgi:hypothetical protein
MGQDIFLTEKQVDELTGISRGYTVHHGTKMERKITKYDCQVSHLCKPACKSFQILIGNSVEKKRFNRHVGWKNEAELISQVGK